MAMRRLLHHAAAALALALAAAACPALANDGPQMRHSEAYAPDHDTRERWVEECSERLTAGYDHARREDRLRDHDRAWESCESYYDDYYAYYQTHQADYGGQRGATMIKRPRRSSGSCACTETVEYEEEYIDEPVRAAPPPTKRVKIAPGKRTLLK